jgi:PAS domain S-box-containing protein
MSGSPRKQALIIEDDLEMASLMKGLLRRRFFIEAEIAPDCITARRLLTSRDFDLITLDYRLPDGMGLDLLDEITESLEHPPVIMVTGHGDEEIAARSFRSRASGYVVKDGRLPDMLTKAVEKALAEISLKRVEKELLDEKVFLEDSLNCLSDLYMMLDIEGDLFRWNRRINEVSGYTEEELASMNILDLFAPESARALINYMATIKESQGSLEDVVLVTRSGERKNYELSISAVHNQERVQVGFCGIGRDITERGAGVDKFKTIAEHATYGVGLSDMEFNIVYVNPYMARVHGYEPDEVLGKPLTIFHPEEQLEFLRGLNEQLTSKGSFNAVEVWHTRKDGSTFPMLMSGMLIKDHRGTNLFVATTAIDITDRKSAEEEVRKSEEKYRSIFDLSPDPIFLVDRSGNVVDANKATLERTGMSLEHLRETNYVFFLVSDNEDAANEAVSRLWEGKEVRGLELKAGTRDRATYLEINASPLFEEGEIKYILCLARDITERKRSEEELLRLNRELEGYARTVSHDLRTPLTSIKLAGENLARLWQNRDRVDDIDAEIHRISEVIGIGASQAEELIGELLKLALAGQEPEEVSDVDVTATVNRIIDEHDAEIKDKGALVRVKGNLGTVRANPTHVYQLFSNFIDNAIKHNDKPQPVVDILYQGDSPDGHVYVVKDNGPGIDPQDIDNIFLPYFKSQNGDTGIGLAIADKIIKLYDGSVRVEVDNGACFQFSIKDR